MNNELLNQNELLKIRITNLEKQLKQIITLLSLKKTYEQPLLPNNQPMLKDPSLSHSKIYSSPIQTSESIQQANVSWEGYKNYKSEQECQVQNSKNERNIQGERKPVNLHKFQQQDNLLQQSNLANSQVSKQPQNTENQLKKSSQSFSQVFKDQKHFYNSDIRQKAVCQECIHKMHQLHEMQILKNKYHKQYMNIRAQLDKIKSQNLDYDHHQTQRSSLNLIDIYGDPTNEQKSEKSSFSFENIENTLLFQRFSLEIQQFIKLIDRLLPLDRKSIQISSADFKLLFQLEIKLQKLKNHMGIDCQTKYLEDVFNQLQKSENLNKKIHQKYKKLFDKILKVHKQKLKKSRDEFNFINQNFIVLLKDLNQLKIKNYKLTNQIENLKSQSFSSLHESKDLKSSKQNLIFQLPSLKQHTQACLTHLQRTFSQSKQSKCDKQLQKCQSKLKASEKIIKRFQKNTKQLQMQIIQLKKKYQNDINQFMNILITNSHLKIKNAFQQTENYPSQIQLIPNKQTKVGDKLSDKLSDKLPDKIISQKDEQANIALSTIQGLIYEIFSFTSCQSDQQQNVFLPQTIQETVKMLTHIKRFAQKFDQWQKKKQKQTNQFQKNFLQLLKYFINNFKVSEQQLIQQITKMKDNEALILYIKRYYSKTEELNDQLEQFRISSSFTFGQKSESHNSENQS